MKEDKFKEKELKIFKSSEIEEKVFDYFLKNHSNYFKNSIKMDIGKGKVSNGDSIQFLFTSKKEILVRIKKITGKNIFGSLKTEWKDFIIDKENSIIEDESLFSLTDNEKELFDSIKKIKSLVNKRYDDFTKQYNPVFIIDKEQFSFELKFKSISVRNLDQEKRIQLLNNTFQYISGWTITKPGRFSFSNMDEIVFKRSSRSFVLKYIDDNEFITIKFCKIQTSTDKEDIFQKLIDLFMKNFQSKLREKILLDDLEKKQLRIKEEKIQKIKLDKQKTSEKKDSLIKELDKDSDGILDIVQTDDFQEILKKHEKNIIEIDRDYIKNFVKLSNYLKTKRNNLQNTFEILSKVEFSKDLVPLTKILKNKIHTYNSLLLHSLSMIVSLTKDEMITFYEIYEMFDELNVYDSKHEKDMLNGIKSINSELGEVNKNLKEIGGKLGDISGQFYSLMNQMKESDEKIINSIDNLTYTTSSSIESLSNNVQSELQSINSSIKFNNLLTGVQTYQMYKINLNTKSLKG